METESKRSFHLMEGPIKGEGFLYILWFSGVTDSITDSSERNH